MLRTMGKLVFSATENNVYSGHIIDDDCHRRAVTPTAVLSPSTFESVTSTG